jgi:tetratricopeptide (TPR) repeat protein
MLIVVTLILFALGVQAQPDPGAAADTLRRASQAVVDAGYRSDVPTLERALSDLGPLINVPGVAGRAAYFSGFANWQLSLIVGFKDPKARAMYLDAAIRDLQTAVNLDGSDVEAVVLLGHCFGLKRSNNPKGDYVVQLQANALRNRAFAQSPRNPRVALIEAMGLYYRPPQAGGNQERGLARWHEALDLFAKPTPSADVGWGHAEAYFWLSNVHGSSGDTDKARAALEKSLSLRPDFVAAKTALAALR